MSRSQYNDLSSKNTGTIYAVEGTFIVESYINGDNWYRIWSDGWIEQGGTVSVPSSGTALTYLKPFSNTNYSIVSGGASDSYPGCGNTSCYNKTITGCSMWTSDDSSFNVGYLAWIANGY